ncbi:hypothetical protein [Salibacterium sp. K-3]
MAIVGDEWIGRKQRDERLKKFRKSAKELARQVSAGYTEQADTLKGMDAEIKRLQAINAAEDDVAVFAYEYFSDERNAGNAAGNIIRNDEDGTPHETMDEMATIHRDFYDVCNDAAQRKKGDNYVIAAPRGHAKTQIMSVIQTLHALVYRRKAYVLMLSETDSLSKKIVASVATQLKYNEKLREDFGELLYLQTLRNAKDNDEAFITTGNVLVEASSANKSLRGKMHLGYRPDLVIADDISSINNEGTETLRTQLIEWWNSVITPIGSKDTDIIYVGTMVTQSGLLAELLNRRDYHRTFYQAIIKYPDALQLWQDYEQLYVTEDNWQVVEDFYRRNEEEMNEGVQLAWPANWTYRELLHRKINMGAKSFASEFMNESYADDEAVFRVDEYEFYRRAFHENSETLEYNGEYYKFRDMTITGAWDVAMGASERSALNAFVTVGKDEKSGRMFVLDVYATREVPSQFMDAILQRMAEYKHDRVIVEGIGAYSEFHRQLQEDARRAGLYSTRVELIKSHGRKTKESRIEQLEPMFANKSLILNERHGILLEQLRQYGQRGQSLVDAIDALSMAVENVKKPKRRITDKPAWL